MYVMGIDAGTQSIKVLVYDSVTHEKRALSIAPLDLISRPDGTREQRASDWLSALKSALSGIPEEVRLSVECIAVSGQQHGFVPLSEDGEVLYTVKLWCDTSTTVECREITESVGKEHLAKCGNPILPGYTASKILWLRKNHPKLYEKVWKVLLPHDYLNYVLTGGAVMEKGDASGTGLMDIRSGKWDEKLCKAVSSDLMAKLPEIKDPGIIGSVTEEVAGLFGLKEGIAVASGGGDNMMAAIGTGAVIDGKVTISLGTSGTMFASSSVSVTDRENRLASFRSSHGTFLPLLCTMNCTVATEAFRKARGLSVDQLGSLASSAPVGSEGVIFLPFLNGERVPDLPNGEGVFGGLNAANMNDSDMARSIFEGVTYEFLLGLDAFGKVSEVTLTGGGARSAFWRQMISDVLNLPLRMAPEDESAAFGAALQALWLMDGKKTIAEIADEHLKTGEGPVIQPDPRAHEEYMKHYEKWKAYTKALTPLFS
ncbi:MAG: xylulokinase [Bullifex sp.]